MAKITMECKECKTQVELPFKVGTFNTKKQCDKCGGEMIRVYNDIDSGTVLPDNISYAGNKMLWGTTFGGKDKTLI
jgi:NAD-dependent SIR2 family protein deacetylase